MMMVAAHRCPFPIALLINRGVCLPFVATGK